MPAMVILLGQGSGPTWKVPGLEILVVLMMFGHLYCVEVAWGVSSMVLLVASPVWRGSWGKILPLGAP